VLLTVKSRKTFVAKGWLDAQYEVQLCSSPTWCSRGTPRASTRGLIGESVGKGVCKVYCSTLMMFLVVNRRWLVVRLCGSLSGHALRVSFEQQMEVCSRLAG
jgi:hypothetical protein